MYAGLPDELWEIFPPYTKNFSQKQGFFFKKKSYLLVEIQTQKRVYRNYLGTVVLMFSIPENKYTAKINLLLIYNKFTYNEEKKRTFNGPDFALRSSSLGLLQWKPFYPDFFFKKK